MRDAVVQVLNLFYDAKEVARAKALSQLNNGSKKKKKKKSDDDSTPPTLSEEEKQRIGYEAAATATAFTGLDVMVTPTTKGEFGDYQCNAAIGLVRMSSWHHEVYYSHLWCNFVSPGDDSDCAAKLVDGDGRIRNCRSQVY